MRLNRLILTASTLAFFATLAAAIALGHVSAQNAPAIGEANPATTTPTAPINEGATAPGTTVPGSGTAEPTVAARHPGLDAYTMNCLSCHTVGGGPAVGPDLAGLMSRVPSRAWAVEFIKNPTAMIAKDEYAKALRAKYSLDMSGFAHLGDRVIEDLIDFIDAGGPGLVVKKARESTAADIELGRRLFTGEKAIVSGAPACISCHTVGDLGGLGGGTLASTMGAKHPSLAGASARAGGENGLRSALAAPQFLVMREVFAAAPLTEDEVIAVSAYLADAGKQPEASAGMAGSFALWGVVGAGLLVILLDILWIKRFRSVRKALVGGDQ